MIRLSVRRRLLIASSVAALTAAGVGCVIAATGATACDLDEAARRVRANPTLLMRDGRPLGGEPRFVELSAIPPHVLQAFVAVEDRRFHQWYHRGVDPVGVIAALLQNLKGGRPRGASTIAMQTARALCRDEISADHTWPGKLAEAFLGVLLTIKQGRARVLELYVNTVYLGAGTLGIEMGSRRYFARRAEDLSPSDAAELAHLVASPARRDPRRQSDATRRANVSRVFAKMAPLDHSFGTTAVSRRVSLTSVVRELVNTRPIAACAMREAEGCIGRDCPNSVVVFLDSALQVRSQSEVDLLVRRLERMGTRPKQGRLDAMFVAMEATTGMIRAWVPRRSDNVGGLDLVANGRIQPASALKPLLLAAAFDAGLVKPEWSVGTMLGHACPGPEVRAYIRKLSGYDRARDAIEEALWRSDNVLGPCLLAGLGATERQRLVRAGLLSRLDAHPVDGMGIGTVRPLQLLSAYAALANGGEQREPRCSSESLPRSGPRLFSLSSARTTMEMLGGVVRRGTARAALEQLPDDGGVAGKTGTAQDSREMLFVGFRRGLVALFWVGVVDGPGRVPAASAGVAVVEPWARIMKAAP